MPLDWWLAFLVFLLGASVILLVAIGRTVRRHARAAPREESPGPAPQVRTTGPTPSERARARPAPYLAYVDDPEPEESAPHGTPPQPEILIEAAASDRSEPPEPEHEHEDVSQLVTSALVIDALPEPTPQPVPANAADATDLPWWEQSFVHNPPPISTIATSARPWHDDGPLPELPPKPRPNIYALLTAGARASTTVTTGAVKGNRSSGLYHTVDSPWYERTKADEWFDSPRKAEAAGYSRWNSRSTRNTG